MKIKGILLSALLFISANAENATLLSGMRFGAPTVNDHTTLDTSLLDAGDIVFDTDDANFYGFAVVT